MFEVWKMVFNEKYYVAAHESRVWCRKEDSVHHLSEAIPQEMESGTTYKAIASCMSGEQWNYVPKFAK